MTKYVRLYLIIGLFFVACGPTPFRYNYLINPLDGFYESNYRHPNNIDEYIEYLKYFQSDFESEMGESLPIYDDFFKNKKHLKMVQDDSFIYVIYRTDTIDYQSKRHPCDYDEISLDRWSVRPFLRVIMHSDASPYNNVATEEMMGKFNKGLYDIIATYLPEFKTHFKNRDNFNVSLLYSESGQLQKFCQGEALNMDEAVMQSITCYVNEYMMRNFLSKIFFYYIYY